MSSIIRHDPLEDLLRGFFVRPVGLGISSNVESPEMRVDVHELANAYELIAELPGVDKDNIHVHIEGALVSISTERLTQQNKEDSDGRVLRAERYFGKISRSFQLGQEVDEDASSAKFIDGVLTLHLPKKAAAQARRLTISSS